jgi:hypothetical protein
MKTLFFLLLFSAYCVKANSQDIRNVSWGMTPAMVQQTESNVFFEKLVRDKNNTMIIYKDFILGDSVYVWYQFLYDSLASVTYQLYNSSIFEEPYSDMLKYVESLTKKYGDPIDIKWDCRDPKSKQYVEIAEDKNSEFKYNFYTGDITSITYRWMTQKSSVVLLISSTTLKVEGRDFKTPQISVLYRTLNFERTFKKAQSESINEKL